ncbi:MAG TPA: rod shape-determining protein MreC [Candidatus Angelobacter sp.]|nr:rod shape-determining protein MreC [Candidatus Angelobacter sp.]
MENFFVRYKNPLVLMAVLFIQVVVLATQVKRQENARAATSGGNTRLIRVWSVNAFTPVEKALVSTGHFFRDSWHNYADLRGIRKQNRELQDEVSRLQMEQVRLKQDADQARRLQALLDFKEQSIAKTVAAQVIGTSGTEQSRVIYIDKGKRAGIKVDMPVITPDGIVGKIKDVFDYSSQVLLINDHDSGAGVILEKTRLQGIVKGTSIGELQVNDIMADENVEPGEQVVTSGGDRIYPKGLAVGTVSSSVPDHDNDPFLIIKIKPAADLRRLEEVLVITEVSEKTPTVTAGATSVRAADILAQRLPSVPKQEDPKAAGTTAGAPKAGASPTPADKAKNAAPGGTEQKKETASAGTGAPKPATPAGTAATPASAKPSTSGNAGANPAIQKASTSVSATGSNSAAASKPGSDSKKPAGTGQSAASNAGINGTATPTPTPKPKTTQSKKKEPASPDAAQSDTNAAGQSEATPTPAAGEKPPQ